MTADTPGQEARPASVAVLAAAVGSPDDSAMVAAALAATVADAVRVLLDEDLADHVDLNFGCPVAKVTRRGGGAALPWKTGLFTAVVRAAVRAAAIFCDAANIGARASQPRTWGAAFAISRSGGIIAVAVARP